MVNFLIVFDGRNTEVKQRIFSVLYVSFDNIIDCIQFDDEEKDRNIYAKQSEA